MCIHKDIIKLDFTSSTNNYAAQLLKEHNIPEITVVYTSNQTNGRGQINNKWESEPFKNLTCSFILKPDFLKIENHFYLSQMFSLAVVDVLSKYVDNIKIKWPNDIYAGNKKIAGILIENSIMGCNILSSIIGIGLNINQTLFLSDAPNPTSMKLETSKDFDVSNILNQLLDSLINWYDVLRNENIQLIKKCYIDNLFRYNSIALYKNSSEDFLGKIIDVLPSGKLVIESDKSVVYSFNFKEVEFII